MTLNSNPLSDSQKIDILLVEYGVLYSLLQWRLTASDRRLFVAGALIVGVLSAMHALNAAAARLLLWGLPVLLWVILTAAVGHARSKEDLLRRIDEIEQRVNRLAGIQLLAFQSRRPTSTVGGRTGTQAVNGTLALCISVVLGATLFLQPVEDVRSSIAVCYGLWAAAWAAWMIREAVMLRNYRYERRLVWLPADGN